MKFLKEILNFVDSGKKVILISEDIPSFYTQTLRMKEFDEIWPRFGIRPYPFYENQEEWDRFSQKIDFIAFREIPPYTYLEWRRLIGNYKIFLEIPFDQVLYKINPKPRSFVKFVKLFPGQTTITADKIKEKTLELLKKKVSGEVYKFYKILINQLDVVNSPGMDLKIFARTVKALRGPRNLKKLERVMEYAEEVCITASRKLPLYNKAKLDPRVIVNENYKQDRIGTLNVLKDIIKEKVPEEEKKTVNEVIKIYFKATRISHLEITKAKQLLETLEERLGGNKKYLNRLVKDLTNCYIQDFYQNDWLLHKPFELAFSEILYETPTIKTITQK